MTLTLSIPDIRLSPNGRCHWSAKARLVKKARSSAFWLTLQTLGGAAPPAVSGYSLTYHWPSTRRDDDNAIASAKPYMDGICEALRIDDKTLRFRDLTHASDRKQPRLEITLHLTTDAAPTQVGRHAGEGAAEISLQKP